MRCSLWHYEGPVSLARSHWHLLLEVWNLNFGHCNTYMSLPLICGWQLEGREDFPMWLAIIVHGWRSCISSFGLSICFWHWMSLAWVRTQAWNWLSRANCYNPTAIQLIQGGDLLPSWNSPPLASYQSYDYLVFLSQKIVNTTLILSLITRGVHSIIFCVLTWGVKYLNYNVPITKLGCSSFYARNFIGCPLQTPS